MTCLNGASISGVVVPFLLEISKDSIPNVKIASAKALKICYKATNSQNDKVIIFLHKKFICLYFNLFS